MAPTLLSALHAWQEAEARYRGIHQDLVSAVARLDFAEADQLSQRQKEAQVFAAEMLQTTLQILADRSAR